MALDENMVRFIERLKKIGLSDQAIVEIVKFK